MAPFKPDLISKQTLQLIVQGGNFKFLHLLSYPVPGFDLCYADKMLVSFSCVKNNTHKLLQKKWRPKPEVIICRSTENKNDSASVLPPRPSPSFLPFLWGWGVWPLPQWNSWRVQRSQWCLNSESKITQ